jgi:hypothetical protein
VLLIGSTIRSEIVGRTVIDSSSQQSRPSSFSGRSLKHGRWFAYLIVVMGNFMENSVIKLVIRLRQARVENCELTDVF